MSAYRCDASAIRFFASYLDHRTQFVYLNGRQSYEGAVQRGVPQGSILGPLLFSLFINDLPLHITCPRVTCSLFADDGTLDVSATDVSIINRSLQQSLNDVAQWCEKNKMVANPSKTKCMLITTRQKQQRHPPSLHLHLDSKPIEQVAEHRVLGVTLDEEMSWKPHVTKLRKTLGKNVFLLSKLRLFTDEETRMLFYNAHIQPHLDYCSTVWDGASQTIINPLNSLHRRSAKLIIDTRMNNLCTDDKLATLDIMPLQNRFYYNKLVLMFKMYRSKAPEYLSCLLTRTAIYRTLRNDLVMPTPHLFLYRRSLAYSGAQLWNSIPKTIKSAPSLASFKAQLHKYISSGNLS